MKAAFLINERAMRERLTGSVESIVECDEYSTAAKALVKLTARDYDIIVLHWRVHPGLGSGDAEIDELAALLPDTELNRNLLYWEAALRVMDILRAEDSANTKTPLVVILPDREKFRFIVEDQLSEESVLKDISSRGPATPIWGASSTKEFEKVLAELS